MSHPAPTADLTPASLALFIELAGMAVDWAGQPLLEQVTPAERGNITDLKVKGLLTTDTEDGCIWVQFTDAGRSLAAQHGIDPETMVA